MEKQSRTRKVILIMLGISVVCSLLCLVPFFMLGGVGLLSANRIVMGTAVRNQQIEPPAESIVQEPVENTPEEYPRRRR